MRERGGGVYIAVIDAIDMFVRQQIAIRCDARNDRERAAAKRFKWRIAEGLHAMANAQGYIGQE